MAQDFPDDFRLSLGSALTVGFRSADSEKQNVEIAEDGHDQGIVQALSPDGSSVGMCIDEVAYLPHDPGNRSAADDGHDHHARTVAGERTELGYPESEDAREHDGVEESHQQDGPHSGRAVAEN